MKNLFTERNIKTLMFLVWDVVAVFTASVLSIILIENDGTLISNDQFIRHLPITMVNIVLVVAFFSIFKLYSNIWKFAGLVEGCKLILVICIVAVLDVISNEISKSCFDFILCSNRWLIGFVFIVLVLTCASRFSHRLYIFLRSRLFNKPTKTKKVMIVGAGEAGSMLIREISLRDKLNDVEVACLIDDDPNKLNKFIHGIKVVGNRNDINFCVKEYQIDEIIISLPSAKRSEVTKIINECQKTGCKIKTLPGIYQLVNGQASVSALRNVEIQDLLGREQVITNVEEVIGYIKDRVVLVSGGGGSIGSELCRQIASHNPKQLIIVDIYENNAYEIEQELKRKYPSLNLLTLIASVRDSKKVNDIFDKYRPEIIFHAAAHKHVPLMETSPNEAIKNNVSGTLKMARAADRFNAKRFVLISTDKAVNPTNIMGASKRICEMIIQTMSRHSKTEFVAVRFGNVLGSNGSVIPLFKKQIQDGGPITVTHKDITRYFMTIPEAVALVLQAGAYAKGGEIFVLDMGEPVKIYDLAVNLIKLSGLEPNVDIKIEITGLRPGEKLYEERLMEEEGMQKTANELISIGKPLDIDEDNLLKKLDELYIEAYNETDKMKELVKQLVPTYIPDNSSKGSETNA